MKEHLNRSVTLLELLIAIVLLSVIILGLTSIDFFSRNNVINADIRAGLQNKAYIALEHIRKNIMLAIGNENLNYPALANTVVADPSIILGYSESARLKVYVDGSGDGIQQASVNNPPANVDHWVAYRVFYNQGALANRYQLQYCDLCRNDNCNSCMVGWVNVVPNIIGFIPVKPMDANSVLDHNYVDVTITTCLHPEYNYDADPNNDCGSKDNPQATMETRITLPSVPAH